MLIRRMQDTDVEAVVALALADYDGVMAEYHSAEILAGFRSDLTPEFFREAMCRKQVFVVEESGELVATGALADFGTLDEPKHTVSQFYVRPDFHARGIGAHLLSHVLRVAADAGAEVLHVPSSRNAIGFYEHAGFIVDGSQPDAGIEITWMTLPLRGSRRTGFADRDRLQARLARGDCFLTEAAIVERLRREFRIPADEHLVFGGAIYDAHARDVLRGIYRGYVEIAQRFALPILLTSSTRRCNPERIAASRRAGQGVNQDWMTFLREVRGSSADPVFLGGLLGARGDAYRPQEALSEQDALAFHRAQCQACAEGGAEFLMAATLPALGEAVGLAEAMGETGLPFILSFIIDRAGLLLDGTPVTVAMAAIDDICPPVCYLVNCVHPGSVLAGLATEANRDHPALPRLKGIQANTSLLSPVELDDSPDLHADGADSLVGAMLALRDRFAFQIFGGCCGTDAAHLEEVAARLSGTTGAPAGRC
jgi:S-methylmethionine-dependent homocysteine/selenocysteine methylase/GNAT superfamily N-acetyltransferase